MSAPPGSAAKIFDMYEASRGGRLNNFILIKCPSKSNKERNNKSDKSDKSSESEAAEPHEEISRPNKYENLNIYRGNVIYSGDMFKLTDKKKLSLLAPIEGSL